MCFLKESKNPNDSTARLRGELLVRLAHLQRLLFLVEAPPEKKENFREILLLQGQSFREVFRLINGDNSGGHLSPKNCCLKQVELECPCLTRVEERLSLALAKLGEVVARAEQEKSDQLVDQVLGWKAGSWYS